MKKICLLLLLTYAVACAQTRMEMPVLGVPLPKSQFELINKIPNAKLATLPKELASYKWSRQPRHFSAEMVESLLKESVFAGTNLATLNHTSTNKDEEVKLTSRDNQDYFIVIPASGRIAIQNTYRSREYPPPDAVPDFTATWQRVLRFAERLGISTNEMEHNPDGSIHLRKTENTTSHMGGAVKYKSKRSVTVFRSINGYLVRSLDEDKMEVEVGVDGRLLKFNLKWPNIEAVHTNNTLAISDIMNRIKKGDVLADPSNEYPAGGIAQVELKDFQLFYYVATMFPYGRRLVTTPDPDIQPMIEFLATFKSSKGEKTEGGIFAPLTESP